MRMMLLGLTAAAAALASAPAGAQRWTDANFIAAANVAVHRGGPDYVKGGPGHHRDGDRRHRRRGRGFDGAVFLGGNVEWQGDSAWRTGSYNDWWHERPWRSFPRWVQSNQHCPPERMWWSGGGWRC